MKPGYKEDGTVYPCQKCPECVRRRISGWAFRLMQELKHSTTAHFITLTYDTPHAPTDMFGNYTLRKRDLQLFIKRLRKAHKHNPQLLVRSKTITMGNETTQTTSLIQNRSIKYYAVGEYGARTQRCHYHIILFNASIELIQNAWGITNRLTRQTKHLGSVNYGDERGVTEASITYCFKYLMKPNRTIWKGECREKNFSVCSKGLGIEYLTENMATWHAEDIANRSYCVKPDGRKITMPRYYKDKIFYDGERCQQARQMIQQLMDDSRKVKDIRKHWMEQQAAYKAATQKLHEQYYSTSKI